MFVSPVCGLVGFLGDLFPFSFDLLPFFLVVFSLVFVSLTVISLVAVPETVLTSTVCFPLESEFRYFALKVILEVVLSVV